MLFVQTFIDESIQVHRIGERRHGQRTFSHYQLAHLHIVCGKHSKPFLRIRRKRSYFVSFVSNTSARWNLGISRQALESRQHVLFEYTVRDAVAKREVWWWLCADWSNGVYTINLSLSRLAFFLARDPPRDLPSRPLWTPDPETRSIKNLMKSPEPINLRQSIAQLFLNRLT